VPGCFEIDFEEGDRGRGEPNQPVRTALATGQEKDLLLTHLRLTQQALLWKVEGLSDAELRRPMTKTGTNLIGIVKHLTGVTYGYLCTAFGRERETFPWEFDEELFYGLDMWATPDESPAEILAAYRRACDAAAQTSTNWTSIRRVSTTRV
jgi:hypothetical protein